MFLFGETTEKVINNKLSLPKEYHLRKREILGKWKNDNTLYLSDSDKALNFIAGRDTKSFHVKVDVEDRIDLPKDFDNALVYIKGCISSVELVFHKQQEN